MRACNKPAFLHKPLKDRKFYNDREARYLAVARAVDRGDTVENDFRRYSIGSTMDGLKPDADGWLTV
jgi:hypothetical protein